MSIPRYNYRSLRAGDYWGGFGSSSNLFQDMLANAGRILKDAERNHFREQVVYALAACAVTSDQGTELFLAAGMTEEGGYR